MVDKVWAQVDAYLTDLLVGPDPPLEEAIAASTAAELPEIQVSPLQGRFLMLLAKIRGARRILEIGTLGGYSTIWLARALPPGGELVTLEIEPRHARVARENLTRAGLEAKIDLRVGPAADSLAKLVAEGAAPFDLVFVDADKPSNPDYVELALRLTRPGSVLVIDNVVREGEVLAAESESEAILGTRAMHELVANHPRLEATVLQTVGAKGYDGFTLALVKEVS